MEGQRNSTIAIDNLGNYFLFSFRNSTLISLPLSLSHSLFSLACIHAHTFFSSFSLFVSFFLRIVFGLLNLSLVYFSRSHSSLLHREKERLRERERKQEEERETHTHSFLLSFFVFLLFPLCMFLSFTLSQKYCYWFLLFSRDANSPSLSRSLTPTLLSFTLSFFLSQKYCHCLFFFIASRNWEPITVRSKISFHFSCCFSQSPYFVCQSNSDNPWRYFFKITFHCLR